MHTFCYILLFYLKLNGGYHMLNNQYVSIETVLGVGPLSIHYCCVLGIANVLSTIQFVCNYLFGLCMHI